MHRRGVLKVSAAALISSLVGCRSSHESHEPQKPRQPPNGTITLGFSQVESSSSWRAAQRRSVKRAAEMANVKVRFADSAGRPDKQVADVQSFLDEPVDVIAICPTVRSGWERTLTEARMAGVPVVVVDGAVEVSDSSLYWGSVGADFRAEGSSAATSLSNMAPNGPLINVVEIRGSQRWLQTEERSAGFTDVLKQEPRLRLLDAATGNWTRHGGTEAMADLLSRNPKINAVFSHNDQMGLGAISAIEAADKRPGTDIAIISVDATKAGLTALAAGKMTYLIESDPHVGPSLMDAVVDLYLGGAPPMQRPRRTVSYDTSSARTALKDRDY